MALLLSLQCAIVLTLCSYSLAIRENSFRFRVPAGWYECFYEEGVSSKDSKMELYYEVIRGGGLDIKISLSNPEDFPLLPPTVERKGHIPEILVDIDGPYRICLDNTFSMVSDKVVYLNLIVHERADSAPTLPSNVRNDSNLSESALVMQTSLNKISHNLRKVTMDQRHFQTREARHLQTAQSNGNRVLMWSAIETVFVLAVFTLQVIIVRRFFKGKRNKSLSA